MLPRVFWLLLLLGGCVMPWSLVTLGGASMVGMDMAADIIVLSRVCMTCTASALASCCLL
ncbi:hypothetical protein BBK82_20625 [Lentzea guizhouensis]|uniref:Uncharacterized protein n=1 Tax=Lentzea guizhouensis TaxID=1586287 RepID=A0A1B2HK55_9PSEU|nr:hypothetical protein BBK82_20625 [Lentzea guizhouensis]